MNFDLTIECLKILKEIEQKKVESFAKIYLEIDIKLQDMNFDLTVRCLNILERIEQKKVESFAKIYLDIDIKLQDINATLAIKCLNILKGVEQEKVKSFAKAYLDIDIKLQDMNVALTIECLNILKGIEQEKIESFAKQYFLLDKLDITLVRACFNFMDKTYEPAIAYAEEYIEKTFNNHGDFTVNSALKFLQENNQYKRKLGLREFEKLEADKHYLKSNPDRKSQIINIMIDNNKLRRDISLRELNHLFNYFPECLDHLFKNNRTLINSCLLALQKEPKSTKKYVEKILKNYDSEITFKDNKNYSYHWHIIRALENPYVERNAIHVAKEILRKENRFTLEAFLDKDCDNYYLSWILDDTIFELIKADIRRNKDNTTEMQEISKILSDLCTTRKKIYELCSENKVLNYINILNAISFYEEVLGDICKAIGYKEEVLVLVKKSKLLDKEEKIRLYSEELSELKLKEPT